MSGTPLAGAAAYVKYAEVPSHLYGAAGPPCGTSFLQCGRSELFRLFWPATIPLRQYAIHPPLSSVKAFLLRKLLPALLPGPPAHLLVFVPGGGRVRVEYAEEIALLLLLYGAYEAAEIQSLSQFAEKGSTGFDVGANLGLYTVAMAGAVGDSGRIIAIEPVPDTLQKLRSNVAMNALGNVHVVAAAAADYQGTTDVQLANDSAYASIVRVKNGRHLGAALTVPVVTVDALWEEQDRPSVSFFKIDVEGAELMVLKGAVRMLRACRPAILLEAEGSALDTLSSWLADRGYSEARLPGFVAWNHLFLSVAGSHRSVSV